MLRSAAVPTQKSEMKSLMIIQFLLLLNMLIFYYHNMSDKKGMRGWIEDFGMLIFLAGRIISIGKNVQQSRFKPGTVQDELARNGAFLNKHLLVYDNVRASEDDLSLVSANHGWFSAADDFNSCKIYDVKWSLGRATLLNQVKLISEQQKLLVHQGINPKSELPDAYRAQFNGFPTLTANCDMTSKGRLLEYLMIPSLYSGSYLADSLLVNPYAKVAFKMSYAAMCWLLARQESYLVKKVEYEMNLEGFVYVYPLRKEADNLPTCILSQIGRDMLFSPTNKVLRRTLDFIAEGEHEFKALASDEKIGRELRNQLSQFPFYMREVEQLRGPIGAKLEVVVDDAKRESPKKK